MKIISYSLPLFMALLAGAPTVQAETNEQQHTEASLEAYQQVIIEFNQPSLVEMVVAYQKTHGHQPTPEQQKAYTQSLIDYQNSLIKTLKPYDTVHIKNFTTSINGLKCWLHNDDRADVLKLPGVKAIRSVNRFKPMQSSIAPSDLGDDYFKAIGVEALHQQGYTGKGQVIAVIDSGINYYLKGLGGTADIGDLSTIDDDPTRIEAGTFPNEKVIGGFDFAGTKGTTPDNDPVGVQPPSGDALHGTFVAALAAGDTGFAFYSGIAPDAKLLAIKVFDDNGGNTASTLISDGIDFALDPNQDGSIDDRADVINLSLGSEFGAVIDQRGLSAEQVTVERAHALGVVVVAAAGNDGHNRFNLGLISALPQAIGVGAARITQPANGINDDFIYRPTDFTSSGPNPFSQQLKPDVMAPGYQIPYFLAGAFNGTSFASPLVAGLAAALLQKHPNASPDDIKTFITNATVPALAFDEDSTRTFAPQHLQGAGVIQADKAGALNSHAAPALLSLGLLEPEKNTTIEKTITVTNRSNTERVYRTKVQPNQTFDGLRYDATRRITIPANSQKDITLRIRMNAQALAALVPEQADIDGWLVLDDGEQTLRIAYLGIIKPASRLALKTTDAGSIVIKRTKTAASAQRFVAVDYSDLSILTKNADVPRIGATLIEEDNAHYLQLLVAYNNVGILPFADNNVRKALSLNIDFVSDSVALNQSVTTGLNIGLNGFARRGQRFQPLFTLFFNPRITIINTPQNLRSNTETNATVEAPMNSRHLLIKLPLENKPQGNALLNITANSRNNLFESSDFIAKGSVQFNTDEQTTVLHNIAPQRTGNVVKFDKRPLTFSNNHLWFFKQNSNATNVAFEQALPIAQNIINNGSPLLIEQQSVTQTVQANTLHPFTLDVSNISDGSAEIIITSADGRVSSGSRFGDLIRAGSSDTLDIVYDASGLQAGESINTHIVLTRSENNQVLAEIPLTLNVTPLEAHIFVEFFNSSTGVFDIIEGNIINVGNITLGDFAEIYINGTFDNISPEVLPITFNANAQSPDIFTEGSSDTNIFDTFFLFTGNTLGEFEHTLRLDFGDLKPAQEYIIKGEVIP